MLKSLLAQEINIKTTAEDLHAKMIVTDKAVVVSSVNLNNINLGFHITKRHWRENTESIFLCKRPEIVRIATEKFLEIFNQSRDVRDELSRKIEGTVQEMLSNIYQLRSSSEVKSLFAKFILKKQIDTKKLVIKVGRITKKLMAFRNEKTVKKQDFLSAIVLYYLSERKLDLDQLREKLSEVDPSVDPDPIVSALMFSRLIEKDNDFYKIKVETLMVT
jgi:hypothetical protein